MSIHFPDDSDLAEIWERPGWSQSNQDLFLTKTLWVMVRDIVWAGFLSGVLVSCDLLKFLLLILIWIFNWRLINIELQVSHCGLQVQIVGFISANMTFLWCTWTSWTCAFQCAQQSQKHSLVSEKQQGTKNVIFYWGTQDLLGSIRLQSICSHFLPQAMSEFQHFKGKGNYSEGGDVKFEGFFSLT